MFDYIRGLDDRIKAKPCPDGALDVAEKLGCTALRGAVHRRQQVDMQTAVNAGFYLLRVLWGFRTERNFVTTVQSISPVSPADILE